jgi:hypothetical protein
MMRVTLATIEAVPTEPDSKRTATTTAHDPIEK